MGEFLSCFTQIIFLTLLPLLLFGFAIFGCRRLYIWFVGTDSGKPFVLFASVLSAPLRELGHAMMAMLFMHRIETMRLLDLRAPKGELGYVEHSYNPRNPIAVLGNLFYALGPAITGLLATMLVLLTCFHGVLEPFWTQIRLLSEAGADASAYIRATFSLIPALFAGGDVGVLGRFIGILLLLMICLGVYVTLPELVDALFGCGIFAVITAVLCAVLMLFDARVMRNVLSGLQSFSAALIALYLVVLAAAAAMVALALAFGVIRTLFNIDTVEVLPDEDED